MECYFGRSCRCPRKIVKPYVDATAIIMQTYMMPETGMYDILKSTNSSIDDPSAHVIELSSYWLKMAVVFTLKDILGRSFFLSGGSEKRRNGTLNVVDFVIFS